MAGGSLGGVTSAAFGGPGASGGPSPAVSMSASPARMTGQAQAQAQTDVFGGDFFQAQGPGSQGSPAPARPPLPSEGSSPQLSQNYSPARRASKSAFDDLNDSIRAALGSPAKQAGPMAAQAGVQGQGLGFAPQGVVGMPVAGAPAGFPPGSGPAGFGSPAKQPLAAAGD